MTKSVNKGQISIYLCIILMSVIGLAALLVDISRISAGDALVKKAVRSAARSSLAEYSTSIKDDYGIFALSSEKCSETEATVKKYLEINLTSPENSGTINLYDFKIEELKVTPLFNLTEDEVFRQQILEYMKFRAPKELIEGFIDRLEIFKDAGKMSEAYKKKVAIDKMAGSLDKNQQKLKKSVDGTGVSGEKFINSFNKDGCLKSAYNKYLEFNVRYKTLMAEISGVDATITSLREELESLSKKEGIEDNNEKTIEEDSSTKGNTNSDADEIKKKEISTRLSDLVKRKYEISELISGARSSIGSILEEMQFDMTEPYININENAVENVKNIVEAGVKVSSAANELEAFLKESFGISNPLLTEFLKTATEDINKIKGLLLSGEKAEALLTGFTQNSICLKELAVELQTATSLVRNGVDIGQASDKINSLISKYNMVTYDYVKPDKGDKKDDPRSGKAEAVKQFLEENVFKDKNYLSSGINKDELPSNKKLPSENFEVEDAPYLQKTDIEASQDNNQDIKEDMGAGSVKEESNFGNEVNLYDEEGMFQENAFGIIGSMGSILSGDITALRDELYINEYIMGTFKNAVTQVSEGTEVVEDTDLGGGSKKLRDTFYDNEVEYILHGNPSQNTNKALTAGQLLLVRFGLNTLHVYTDAKKKELATVTAAAVAGWWTGGAGIPVISNLIMSGWGLGEALIDVKDLLAGKKVPVFKSKGDWKLDIGISKEGPKTDSRLAFSYHDYLRLFLLTKDSESKLGRMEDLIELNIGKAEPGFKMSSCKTYVRVEAVVSMKYLFATQAFMPVKVKTADGRHKFKVLVYEGY